MTSILNILNDDDDDNEDIMIIFHYAKVNKFQHHKNKRKKNRFVLFADVGMMQNKQTGKQNDDQSINQIIK